MPFHDPLETLANSACTWGGGGEEWSGTPHYTCGVCAVVCVGQLQTHVVAHTSTYCPTVKWAAVMGVPTGNNARLVTRNSHSFRFRGVPALAKWPRSGPDTYTHTHTQHHPPLSKKQGSWCEYTYPVLLGVVHSSDLEGIVALLALCTHIHHLVVDNLQWNSGW